MEEKSMGNLATIKIIVTFAPTIKTQFIRDDVA